MAVTFLWAGVLMALAWLAYQLRYGQVRHTAAPGAVERSMKVSERGRELAFDLPVVVHRARRGPVRSLGTREGALVVQLADGTRVHLGGMDPCGCWQARSLAQHPAGTLRLVGASVDHGGGSVTLRFSSGWLRYRVRGTEASVALASAGAEVRPWVR